MDKVLIIIVAVVTAVALSWLPVYFLWNWLMPSIFDIREVTVFEALGLVILVQTLFPKSNNS